MTYFIAAVALLLVSFGVQEFVPTIDWAYGATVLVVPTLFFCVAVTISYPVMLLLAVMVGILWDARHLCIAEYIPEAAGMATQDLAFGYSVLLFGFFGSFMQGIRPRFRRGRFGLPVLMVGVCTSFWLVSEYLLITFRRGELDFPEVVWLKVGTTALLSILLSPFVLLLLHLLAGWTRYEIRYDGLAYRTYGR